jgi:hypothetical protein
MVKHLFSNDVLLNTSQYEPQPWMVIKHTAHFFTLSICFFAPLSLDGVGTETTAEHEPGVAKSGAECISRMVEGLTLSSSWGRTGVSAGRESWLSFEPEKGRTRESKCSSDPRARTSETLIVVMENVRLGNAARADEKLGEALKVDICDLEWDIGS